MTYFDSANSKYPRHFPLGKVVDSLVSGNSIFIEAAGLIIAIQDDNIVAKRGKPMRAGKAGRTAADHGDTLAGVRSPFEQLNIVFEHRIGGVALQQADCYWLVFVSVTHASFLTQDFGRADSCTHATHNVLAENRMR